MWSGIILQNMGFSECEHRDYSHGLGADANISQKLEACNFREVGLFEISCRIIIVNTVQCDLICRYLLPYMCHKTQHNGNNMTSQRYRTTTS
jgi:hypothetical protein